MMTSSHNSKYGDVPIAEHHLPQRTSAVVQPNPLTVQAAPDIPDNMIPEYEVKEIMNIYNRSIDQAATTCEHLKLEVQSQYENLRQEEKQSFQLVQDITLNKNEIAKTQSETEKENF